MNARQAIRLVAWREINERLRSRVFIVSTVLMLLLVGGSRALNGALSKRATYRVAVVAPAPSGLAPALQRAAKPFEAKVKLQTVPSAAAGREQVNANKVDVLLLLAKSQLVFRSDVDTYCSDEMPKKAAYSLGLSVLSPRTRSVDGSGRQSCSSAARAWTTPL